MTEMFSVVNNGLRRKLAQLRKSGEDGSSVQSAISSIDPHWKSTQDLSLYEQKKYGNIQDGIDNFNSKGRRKTSLRSVQFTSETKYNCFDGMDEVEVVDKNLEVDSPSCP